MRAELRMPIFPQHIRTPEEIESLKGAFREIREFVERHIEVVKDKEEKAMITKQTKELL